MAGGRRGGGGTAAVKKSHKGAFWDISEVPSPLSILNPQAQPFSATATLLLLSGRVLWPLFTDTTCPALARMRRKPAAQLTDEKQPTRNHSWAGEGKGPKRDEELSRKRRRWKAWERGGGTRGTENTSFV